MGDVLSIVIVNWNTCGLLLECLNRLSPIKDRIDVIVVDNASSDGSADVVSQTFPWVRLVRNVGNIGYAAANNQGWRVAKGNKILLLNSDTKPDPVSIFAMVDFLNDRPQIGVVGPYLRLKNGQAQVGAAGWELSLISAFCYQSMLHRLFPRVCKGFYLHQPAFRNYGPIMVDWVSGAAMMTRRDVLQKVGGIPEHYFMYAEDIKFCRMVRSLGYKVVYLPDVEIVHLHGASSAEQNRIPTQWLKSTLFYYQSSHCAIATRMIAMIFAAGSLLRAIVLIPWLIRNYPVIKNKLQQYVAYSWTAFSVAISTKNKM